MRTRHECDGCGKLGATRLDDSGNWWHLRCAGQQRIDTHIPRPDVVQKARLTPESLVTENLAECWRDGCQADQAADSVFCPEHRVKS